MSPKNCLGCYQPLGTSPEPDGYHKACSKKLFGTDVPPLVDFGSEQLEELAKDALSRHVGITGVQPKVSVDLEKRKEDPTHRLMIIGPWGSFILKPPSPRLPDIPVVEDATMHMAEAAGITSALHGLIKLKSGELAYVTRRFDREKHRKKIKKVAVEDFCQLSGLLTERKYKTSMEKAGKIILSYSSNPGLDVVTFFDLALFSFLTGNSDMHLKNFSLMTKESGEIGLTPAYDLISTRLMPIDDPEETALTTNGKKARLTREDFEAMGKTLKIQKKAVENSFERLDRALPKIKSIISTSFLSPGLKNGTRNSSICALTRFGFEMLILDLNPRIDGSDLGNGVLSKFSCPKPVYKIGVAYAAILNLDHAVHWQRDLRTRIPLSARAREVPPA